MDIIGVQLFVAKILAHLSPPDVARMRLLNKDICARISAGPYAQMFWRKESYQDFVFMLSCWKVDHVKQAAKWFWSIDQFMKLEWIRVFGSSVKNCFEAGIITNPYTHIEHNKSTIQLVFALIENLCTLDEVLECDHGVMERGFKSGIILNFLRKRKYNVMKYFLYNNNRQSLQYRRIFKNHKNFPFSVEEVLEYCMSRNTQFPFVLTCEEVCANIQKGIWIWKEIVDYCIENQDGGETTVGAIIEGYGNMKFQEILDQIGR